MPLFVFALAGASNEVKQRAALSADNMLEELMNIFLRRMSHAGLSAKIADELCTRMHEGPANRSFLVRRGEPQAVRRMFSACGLTATGSTTYG